MQCLLRSEQRNTQGIKQERKKGSAQHAIGHNLKLCCMI